MIKSRNCPICPLKISGCINKEEIKEKTISRISLSNQKTVIIELNIEHDFEDFPIRIRKIIYSKQKISGADISMKIYSSFILQRND